MPYPGEDLPASAFTIVPHVNGRHEVTYQGVVIGWVRHWHALDRDTGAPVHYWRGYPPEGGLPKWWAYRRLDLLRIMAAEAPEPPGGTAA